MNKKVLLVDDDVQMLEEFTDIFKNENIELVTAGSGQDALKAADGYAYDVAIVDNKLPDSLGVDLIDQLKKRRPSAIYILITAYVSVESAIAALHKGVFDYIVKPFNPDELMTTVRKAFALLDSKGYASQKVETLLEERDLLEEKLKVVEKINEIFMDREGKIMELKKEVNSLMTRLKEDPKDKIY